MIKVAIVEDTPEISDALQLIISSADDMELFQAFSSAEAALAVLPAKCADIVLMDIHLPGMNGVECVKKLSLLCPSTQFLMCTVYEDEEHIFDALKAGATGYIVKKTPADKLLAAIRELHAGGSPMSASIARRVITSFKTVSSPKLNESANELGDREKELLVLLAQGLFYKEIAGRMNISIDTVKKHCNNIYRKLQVGSRTEAINKVFSK